MPGFLIDLDGVIYEGLKPIPHAAHFIQTLQQKRIPFLFLTNNSSRTPETVCDHLQAIGIKAMPDNVVTSAQVTTQYIRTNGEGKRIYPIGGEGLSQSLKDEGFELVLSDDDKTADFVVQGLDKQFTYEKMAKAVRHILNGATFISTNTDRLLPAENEFLPGSGSITAAIQNAVQVEPIVIGKPSPIMMQYALEKMGLPKEDVWMVGDNIDTDIAGGVAVKCRTALVLTGVANRNNLDAWVARAGISPEVVVDDLNHLLDHLKINDGA